MTSVPYPFRSRMAKVELYALGLITQKCATWEMRPSSPQATVGSLHTLVQDNVCCPASLNKGASPITSGRSQPAEVHHIERRIDLNAFADDFPQGGLPSVYVRASGYILLVAIAVVVCYSATL